MRQTSKQVVDYYGLHKADDGLLWLIEQGTTRNAVGLPETECPFRIKTHLLMCRHKFDLSLSLEQDAEFVEYERRLHDSALLQFLDPAIENETKICYIKTDSMADFQTISQLQALRNPTVNCSMAADFLKDNYDVISRQLNSSNLASYFLFGISTSNLKDFNKFTSIAMNSRGPLIMAGTRLPIAHNQMVEVIDFEPLLTEFVKRVGHMKLHQIGSYRLKKLMRS